MSVDRPYTSPYRYVVVCGPYRGLRVRWLWKVNERCAMFRTEDRRKIVLDESEEIQRMEAICSSKQDLNATRSDI